MNNASLEQLNNERNARLTHFGLDVESVANFRKEIKQVSQEEADQLGKELYSLVKKNVNENEDTILEEVEKLIKDGANLEYHSDKRGDTVLLLCARYNLVKIFTLAVKAGADINGSNDYKTTSTMASARHGNKDILEMLILLGADINAQCLDGDTALISAKRHDEIDCFEMLKRAGAHFGLRNFFNQTVFDTDASRDFDFSGIDVPLKNDFVEATTSDDVSATLREAAEKLASYTEKPMDKEESKDERANKELVKRIWHYV